MVSDQHLLPIQPQTFLEWIPTRFEQSAAELYPVLQVALHVGVGNLFLIVVSKTDKSGSIMFKSGDFGR
jgi:hypothetical protein